MHNMVYISAIFLLIICINAYTRQNLIKNQRKYCTESPIIYDEDCTWNDNDDVIVSDIIPVDKVRYCSRVMYDGHGFRGWQDQKEKSRTVQGTLGHRFTKRFGIPIRVLGAGRTDHGVHARGQAIHVDLPPVDDVAKLEFVMNRLLPDDIRLYNFSLAPPTQPFWHATASSVGKLYSYRFCTNSFVDPMKRRYTAHAYFPVDLDLLYKCLQTFVGTHDFNAFANRVAKTTKDYENKKILYLTERTVYSIRIIDEGGGYYRVEFHLRSALYRMVRNIMGSSFLVASGQMEFSHLEYLLHSAPSRLENKAGSAPPEGLTLEHVYYNDY